MSKLDTTQSKHVISNMASHEFSIPSEFRTKLEVVEPVDTRDDYEILAALREYVPVTSEKNIWAYWHQGLDDMPLWCKRNICDWVRMCNDWTVRVLDMVPGSPNNALRFVREELLPASFVNGEMSGPYKGQHSKDLLSCACLFLHGGAFMDVGIVLLRSLDRLGWDKLQDPTSPYQIAIPIRYGPQIVNHFIMSRKGDPLVKRWHEIFLDVWKGRRDFKGIISHPLLQIVMDFDFNDPRSAEFKWAIEVDNITIFEYAAQVLCFLRLTLIEGSEVDEFNGAEHWASKVFAYDSLQECFAAERATNFSGEKIYQALSTKLDADPHSAEFRLAYDMTWGLLANSSMMKVTRGSGLSVGQHLGAIWDQDPDADIRPGTFAELLRYGSIHFKQTREGISQMESRAPVKTFAKGALEL